MDDLYQTLSKELNQDFRGWDFSHLSDRMAEFPLTWNYTVEVLNLLQNCQSLLDMGTGGGEYLSTLPIPKDTCATEAYEPNIPIAKKRLEPLGVKVYGITEDEYLPFEDNRFDLIINRHESYSPKEIKRILKPNSIFITQQVGGLNDHELNEWLNAQPYEYSKWNLNSAIDDLRNQDFIILKQKKDLTKTRFFDVGAIVYYLKAIPWQIPDFTLNKYYSKIKELDYHIKEQGYLDVTKHRFLIIAKNNKE